MASKKSKSNETPTHPTLKNLSEAYIAAIQMDGRSNGTASSYANDLKVAEKYFGEAAKIEALRQRIATYTRMAEDALAQNDHAKAANSYRIAAHLAPDDAALQLRCAEVQKLASGALAAGYLKQAAYEENEGRWPDASLSYARAVEGRPEDAFAHELARHRGVVSVTFAQTLGDDGRAATQADALYVGLWEEPVPAPDVRQDFAQRLSQWVGVADAITLHADEDVGLHGDARESREHLRRPRADAARVHDPQRRDVPGLSTSLVPRLR